MNAQKNIARLARLRWALLLSLRGMLLMLAWIVLPVWAHSATLYNRCPERTQSLTLEGSDTAGQRRIWNVNRNGTKYWNYEGDDYEIPLSDKHKSDFNVTLDSFACSEHFNFYYTTAGDHRVDQVYVEQVATQLETAWDELTQNQGFRSPLDLKANGHYEHFTDFRRIPILIYNTLSGQNGAGSAPNINLKTNLRSDSPAPQHELFHVIKLGYTLFNHPWLNEGLADWSEKFVVSNATDHCKGFASYKPITFNLLERDHCTTAPFFDYLGLKYGMANAGGDGSDVVRAILEELGELDNAASDRAAMLRIEQALDQFSFFRTGDYGDAYREFAKGNYVDDTGSSGRPPSLHTDAPLHPRWKEDGEMGLGGDKYLLRNYTFTTRSRGTITIQIRAAAGNFVNGDEDDDDDDLRFLLDRTLLGDWNSSNAIDGSALDGNVQTIHIIRRNVSAGSHTLRVEADEYPILYAVNVFSGEVPLLYQGSGLFKWCQNVFLGNNVPRLVPCFSQDGDPPLLSTTFDVPLKGVSRVTVILEGRASSLNQNVEAGYRRKADDAKVLVDGVELGGYDSELSLAGKYLEGDMAAVELSSDALAPGQHTLEIQTLGKPYIDHVAVFGTSPSLPLFRLNGGRLTPWSTNYHVINVGKELLPPKKGLVPPKNNELYPRNLTIELGTYEWSDEFEPPFHYVLLIDSAGDLKRTITGNDSHSVTVTITPETLNQLGVGGRVVVVVGTSDSSGTYFVQVKR